MIDGTGRILRRHRRCCHWDSSTTSSGHHSEVSYAPDGRKVSLSHKKGNHGNEEAELNRFTTRARPLTIPSCILRAVRQRPVRQPPFPPGSRAFPHSVCLVCAQRTIAASAGPRELQTSTPCASLKIPPLSHLSIPRHARR